MEMKALEDLFLRELAELYDAETQIVKALPKMAKATDCADLRKAFETHLKQTNKHVERLEKIFKAFNREPEKQDSDPISGIIGQGDRLIAGKANDPAVLNAALISTAQKVEHYEIAMYGSARSHATLLGYGKIADLLQETLTEEEQTDRLLTELADREVNAQAAKAPYASARTAPRGGEQGGGFGLGALVSGVLIGAAVALLYAPKSGDKVRRDLKSTADDLLARGEEWRSAAESLLEKGRQTVEEQRSRFSVK
jgi:ferritin-like metal-binding protein YciE